MKKFDDTGRFRVANYALVMECSSQEQHVRSTVGPIDIDGLNFGGQVPDSFKDWSALQYLNIFTVPARGIVKRLDAQ